MSPKRISFKKDVIKKGFNDWLEETALHGLKYMVGRSGLIGIVIWVSHVNLHPHFFYEDL